MFPMSRVEDYLQKTVGAPLPIWTCFTCYQRIRFLWRYGTVNVERLKGGDYSSFIFSGAVMTVANFSIVSATTRTIEIAAKLHFCVEQGKKCSEAYQKLVDTSDLRNLSFTNSAKMIGQKLWRLIVDFFLLSIRYMELIDAWTSTDEIKNMERLHDVFRNLSLALNEVSSMLGQLGLFRNEIDILAACPLFANSLAVEIELLNNQLEHEARMQAFQRDFQSYDDKLSSIAQQLKRLICEFIGQIGLQGNGLQNPQEVEEALRTQDYKAIIETVRSERHREKSLSWLKDKNTQLHGLLLYEQGLIEFLNKPEVETLNTVTLPLFKAGKFRIEQDIACLSPADRRKGKMTAQLLNDFYSESLQMYAKSLLDQDLVDLELDRDNIDIQQTITNSSQVDLPSPEWVRNFDSEVTFLPNEVWQEQRRNFASNPDEMYQDDEDSSPNMTEKLRSAVSQAGKIAERYIEESMSSAATSTWTPEEFEELLRKGDYRTIIANHSSPLDWLKEKHPQLHALLLYEEGLKEFSANPTEETVCQITLPLFKAAKFRVQQDVQCLEKPDSRIVKLFSSLYNFSLNNLVQGQLNKELKTIKGTKKTEILEASNRKIIEVAQQTIETELPSPKWINFFKNGLNLTQNLSFCSSGQEQSIRRRFAEEKLKPIE